MTARLRHRAMATRWAKRAVDAAASLISVLLIALCMLTPYAASLASSGSPWSNGDDTPPHFGDNDGLPAQALARGKPGATVSKGWRKIQPGPDGTDVKSASQLSAHADIEPFAGTLPAPRPEHTILRSRVLRHQPRGPPSHPA